jgi:prepilin-type N-terminal cleavage/methylation domain-containing protein
MKIKKAFTLIELLVVIAIIGLLATLSVLALNNARAKSRDAKRVADIKQIQTALELHLNDAQTYPAELNPGQSISSYVTSSDSTTTYMLVVPAPPTPPVDHTEYTYNLDNAASYTIRYCLEGNIGQTPAGCHTATNSALY